MNDMTMKLMSRFLPSCKEVSQLTSEAMDEPLSWGKRIKLRMHLRMCQWCRRNEEQLHLLKKLAGDQAAAQNDKTKLSTDAKDRMNKFLNQNDDPA